MIWQNRETPIEEISRGAVWPLLPIVFGLGIYAKMKWPFFLIGYGWLVWTFAPCALWLLLSRRGKKWETAILLALFFLLGFFRLTLTFDLNQTHLIPSPYYGPIEGVVEEISQSNSGYLRLRLGQVVLDEREIGGEVQISLHGAYEEGKIWVGSFVQTTGYLGPPSGPGEPGGYNPQRASWLKGIAAVGYTKVPLIAVKPMQTGLNERLQYWRRQQSFRYVEILGERTGGIAAALFVGNRSNIQPEDTISFRRSSLAHLLSISGMHIGAVAGIIYFLSRRFFSLFPKATNTPFGFKLSAISAILGSGFYLLISGLEFAAIRAYLMSLMFFLALIFTRQALSLRTIAFAAVLILIFEPEALFNVGFQMSFAATSGLIILYHQIKLSHIISISWLRWLIALILTSFVAGLATAPFSAYYFHTIPRFGLIANLIAVPITNFVVMPAGVLSFLLQPFGLEVLPIRVAGLGIEWILKVSYWISEMESAVWTIRQGHELSLIIFVALGLCLCLYQRLSWWIGLILVIFLSSWSMVPRPVLLVSEDARFFGVKFDAAPRKFSRGTGHEFVAEAWALADGNTYAQAENSLPKSDPILVDLGDGWQMVFTTTKKGAENLDKYCQAKTLIIAPQSQQNLIGDCLQLSEWSIKRAGGFAIWVMGEELRIVPNISNNGAPWEINRERP